ncbi:EF-hand domain-containing protein [Actinosynnema sp. CA-299493]
MTTTDPIDARIGLLFDRMDGDGDGRVTWADYRRTVERFLDGYRLAADGREGLALRTAYQVWWLELQRHAGGADGLTKDEYVSATRAAVGDTSRANLVDGLSHALFDVMDGNDDGLVDRAEFARLLSLRGFTGPAADGVFDGLDLDRDGFISRPEYVRSWRDFFFADDPDSPGTRYLGRI